MERVEHRIKLNLMKAGLQGQVIVKKADSDSRKINIYLSSAAGPFNMSDIASAILRAEKPDGKVMFNSCIVCKDRLEYIITTQTIAATGTVTCEITLTSKSGQVLVTPRFEIIVADIIYSDSEIESTNEYTALEEAIKKAAALKDGTTFTPHVSDEGVLSWTNADGKDNPAAVNIKGPPGRDGADGSPGAAGADGVTPHIGDNGNWFIGSTDTGKPSRGEKGDPGKDGADGGSGTPGVGDVTPIIGENGNWFVGNTDTGKPSRGEKGDPGKDGVDGSPGAAGADGVTPTIGDNGNWYLGTTDTGEPSRGVAGARGDAGAPGKSGVDGKSAYDVALDNGFSGTTEQWLASLRAPKPVMLSTAQYATETAAVEYMDAQTDKSVVYVWNNKVYCYASKSVSRVTGACLYGYRNSASSGIVSAAGKSTYIIPVSSFSAPLNISNYQHPISNTPYIYGGTTIPTFNKDLIQNDLFIGRTEAFDISAAQLQGCTYVVFAVTTESQPSTASVTVNGTIIPLTVITSPSEIESAVGVETATVGGYIDSGVIYTAIVSSNSAQKYIGERNTYAMPVPLGYCESKVTFEAGTSYLTKYPYATMTQMFSALATANPSYITETVLGKDQSNTYDIKSYVLDAPSSLANGQTSVVSTEKPIFIITAGLHGVEPDAVHTVYHFMQDLAENYYESEQIQYLRDNVKFVIIPICNPWGYANQNYNNSRDVDINKNFAPGYRTNGTSNTGDSAYSEAETQLLKQVFDTYHNAVFHLECHGKYSVDTAFNQTLWFSLMKTLKSELIELNANKINNLIGKRLYNLGYATNKSTGGYITHYALNGRPKDYTGTQYGMLSATMEGTGCIYGETGYSANTQKINCEALENFVLNVFASLNSKIKVYSGDDKNTVATLPRYEGQVS